MGEKYRTGAALTGSVVRNRLKFLIPASILLVYVVWNSSSLSPFKAASSGPVSYTIPSHQDYGNSVQDGRNDSDVSKSEAEAIAAQYDSLKSIVPSQTESEDPNAVKLEATPSKSEEQEQPGAIQSDQVQVAPTQETQTQSQAAEWEPVMQENPAHVEERLEGTVVAPTGNQSALVENVTQEATRDPDSGKTPEEEDAAPVARRSEEDEEVAPNVEEKSEPVVEEKIEEKSERREENSEPRDENPLKIPKDRLPLILGSKSRLAGTDAWKLGPLGSDLRFLEETLRSSMLPYSTRKEANSREESCDGKRIYVYDLPYEFNKELVANCSNLFTWFSFCPYVVDAGRGVPVNSMDNGMQIFVPADKWFNTHQYALEMISHARVMRYKCRTWSREKADVFYIPYYAGLDVIRWHFHPNTTNEKRDALSLRMIDWLQQQKEFVRHGGKDHMLVLGKITWDFRRQPDATWGSRMLSFPELKDVQRLMIERDPWCDHDIGVPHPSYFHPTSARDIDTWLGHIRSQKREYLVTFVGKERKNDPSNPRTALVHQCMNVTSELDCKFVECTKEKCLHPAFVTRAFLSTHFCMQPPGDSPSRRSVFDSLIAGCIPVLFHPQTAYTQYPWHLPRNESLYSVYIPEEAVIKGSVNVVEELKKIPISQRDAMRDYIINTMIPGLIYSAPGTDVSPYRDAFDITIDQVLHRVKRSLSSH